MNDGKTKKSKAKKPSTKSTKAKTKRISKSKKSKKSESFEDIGVIVVDDDLTVTGTVTLTNDLAVTHGGTGASTFTNNGVIYGNAGSALSVTAASSAVGSVLQTAASGGVPAFSNIIDGGTY